MHTFSEIDRSGSQDVERAGKWHRRRVLVTAVFGVTAVFAAVAAYMIMRGPAAPGDELEKVDARYGSVASEPVGYRFTDGLTGISVGPGARKPIRLLSVLQIGYEVAGPGRGTRRGVELTYEYDGDVHRVVIPSYLAVCAPTAVKCTDNDNE